jgi:hypothetical protein
MIKKLFFDDKEIIIKKLNNDNFEIQDKNKVIATIDLSTSFIPVLTDYNYYEFFKKYNMKIIKEIIDYEEIIFIKFQYNRLIDVVSLNNISILPIVSKMKRLCNNIYEEEIIEISDFDEHEYFTNYYYIKTENNTYSDILLKIDEFKNEDNIYLLKEILLTYNMDDFYNDIKKLKYEILI